MCVCLCVVFLSKYINAKLVLKAFLWTTGYLVIKVVPGLLKEHYI